MIRIKLLFWICSLLLTGFQLGASCDYPLHIGSEPITFYNVPLICGAAPEIGCGSRLKPLFMDMAEVSQIKEAWSNRQGTVVAVVWNEPIPSKGEREKIVKPIFKKNVVDAKLIMEETTLASLSADFESQGMWYKGMDVDKLSIEEAGIIAESLTSFAHKEGIINDQETAEIRKEFEEYFKQELVKVRTFDELKSEATQEEWRIHGYQIYVKHIGEERANLVSELYQSIHAEQVQTEPPGKSCCNKKMKKSCCQKS
jgi:hypothetical protein